MACGALWGVSCGRPFACMYAKAPRAESAVFSLTSIAESRAYLVFSRLAVQARLEWCVYSAQ